MAKRQLKRRAEVPRRVRVLRADARVGAAEREIERAFGLPPGSVGLRLPTGRKARTDKLVGSLLQDWGW